MSFGQSISTCFSKYADFNGRASRSEYWWFFLFNFLVGVVASILDETIGVKFIATLCTLALFLPGLGVAVRRCHDTNHSGWWVLCPIYNIVLMFLPSDPAANDYDVAE